MHSVTRRTRIDQLLVERGLFESRAKAQDAIRAGLVTVDGAVIGKPAAEVCRAVSVTARSAHPYVSRGGVKLAAALDHFGVNPSGRICLDVGASTGGFTEVLLKRGARLVYAVDVGRAQLHPRLRTQAAVVSLEQTDIRALDPSQLREPPTFATVDVSFISLKAVLPSILPLCAPPSFLLALIKPQFEGARAGKRTVDQ